MDVTKQNFENVLSKVEETITEATFLAIDCEFTGLNTVGNINAFDTIEEYYNKVRRNCKDFLPIQYGLSAFKYDEATDKFKQTSFNFYIFRRPTNKNIPDQRFLCQTSSIDFLITNDFDFNKLFKDGIPFLNLDEETKYRQNLDEKHSKTKSANQSDRVEVPLQDRPFIDDAMEEIKCYLKSEEREPLPLPRCNPFLRKLIYQTVEDLFGTKVDVETKTNEKNDRILYVTKNETPEESKAKAENRRTEELKVLDDSIGFTKVLRMIVSSGKLVIGHNLMLDLIHTIDKFLTPIPQDYNKFKECAHDLFPNILDTKFMSNSKTFKDLISSTVLGHLLETVKEKPFKIPEITFDEGFGYTLDDKREHEAAYDAFITGVSFLAMWGYVGNEKKLSSQETFGNLNLLKPYTNKIFLMRLQDNPFIHLGGKDPKPQRDHVFHVTFPKDWKTSNVQQLFSPFGNVYVSWVNETSAFVSLYSRDKAVSAYKTLLQHEACDIKTYNEYHLTKNELGATPSPIRRKLEETPTTQPAKKLKNTPNTSKTKSTKTFVENNAWD